MWKQSNTRQTLHNKQAVASSFINLYFIRSNIIQNIRLVFPGPIRGYLHASVSAVVARLRLPKGVHGLDRTAWHHVLVLVQRLLQNQVLNGEEQIAGPLRIIEWQCNEKQQQRSVYGK